MLQSNSLFTGGDHGSPLPQKGGSNHQSLWAAAAAAGRKLSTLWRFAAAAKEVNTDTHSNTLAC